MLGERRVQEAAEPLVSILSEDGTMVEDGVIIALGLLREERAVEKLISLLFEGKDWRKDPDPWKLTRKYPGRIIEALLRIGTDQALEAVLATNTYDFSVNNLRALGQFRHEKVAPTLIKVALSAGIEGNRPEYVKAAIASLGEVGGEPAIATLRSKLFSKNQSVATAASQSLKKLGFAEPFFSSKEESEAARLRHLQATDPGCTDCIKSLIASGADVNAKDEDGRTALMRATTGDGVKALIAAGADAKGKYGRQALLNAAQRGDADSVKALITAGADAKGTCGGLALIYAVEEGDADSVKALIAAGADVNAKDGYGWTALLKAVGKGDADSVKALIAAGADVNMKGKDDETALHKAAEKGDADCVKALIAAGADVNAKDGHGQTALIEAARKGDADSVKALIAAGADVNAKHIYGGTALIEAARKGDADSVKALIAAGADVNAKHMYGGTALWEAVGKGDADSVKALIAAGPDVNMKGKDDETALHKAVVMGDADCVKALIAAGADVSAKDRYGGTALIEAAIVAALKAAAVKGPVVPQIECGGAATAKTSTVTQPQPTLGKKKWWQLWR